MNELDCNGWSSKYKSVKFGLRADCVDPHGALAAGGWYSGGIISATSKKYVHRFMDNGHYVGHDEPSVKFISSAANSGNTMTYYMQVPRDPAKKATNDGKVVDYAELSPAPWFGLALCDPRSYPQNPCKPDSDSNQGQINNPNAAGSAFMELQFYPPGFAPFADDVSCSATKWCVAMNIDSLESKFNFVDLNPACTEPVNFAYLQTNGIPAGPPSPQKTDGATFMPNAHTLMISSGDVLRVAITDPAKGFTTTVTDLTTHQIGWITASAANGFADTNYVTCAGTPHTFHAEYATAAQPNETPWAALEGGVLMEQEIGHSEVCNSLTHSDPINQPGIITDNSVSDTCVGGSEGGKKTVGEGSCNAKGICQNPETEGTTGPIACPSDSFVSGELCEYADGSCIPQGTRTITLNGQKVKETSPVNFCQDNRFQNGDLDFDGIPYQATTWPNGSSNVPTSARYVGPFDQSGHTYPKVQFETDVAGSEFLCNGVTGINCVAPPVSAKFYPFWTLTNKAGQGVGHGLFPNGTCTWNFGNVIRGVTTRDLGKDAEYGVADRARFAGTLISPIEANPEIATTHGCTALRLPRV